MDIPTLKVFLDLCETLNFSRSSERRHVSPSTLSRQIARLESNLGATLFERDNRSVALTAAGAEFQAYALRVLAEWEALQQRLQRSTTPLEGEISLFASVTASHSLLADMLSKLAVRQPGIDLKLHTGDQASSLERLEAGKEDMVIAVRPNQLNEAVAFQVLARSRLVFIAPRLNARMQDLLRPALNSPTELDWSQASMIIPERGFVRQHVELWLAEQGIRPRIYAQVAGHEAIVSMVALGRGLALVPELVLESSPVRDSIMILEAWPELGDFEIGLCTLKYRLSDPLIEAVWQAAGTNWP